MMKCAICGKELSDNTQVCSNCGSTLKTDDLEMPTGETPVMIPTETPKKKRKGMVAAIVTAVLLVVVVATVAGAVVALNTPSVKVPMAIGRSFQAYAGISERMGLASVLDFMQEQQAYSAAFELRYLGMEPELAGQLNEFEDLGIRADLSYSLKDKVYSGNATLFHDEKDLMSLVLGVDNEIAWLQMPQLMEGQYGANTTVLGETLENILGVENEGLASYGFNVFELAEKMMELQPSQETEKAFADAFKALQETIVYEAGEDKTVEVNGTDMACETYLMLVSEEALEDYLDAMEDALEDHYDRIIDVYEDLYRSMGMPEEALEITISDMKDALQLGQIMDALQDAVEEIGDLEFELYLKGGYVMALVCEMENDYDETLTVTLNMGGGKNYENDFSLVWEIDGETALRLTSSGNHTGDGGKFSDETEIEIMDADDNILIASEYTYAPKEDGNNFSWELSAQWPNQGLNDVSLEAEGRLSLGENSFALELEELTLEEDKRDILTLGFSIAFREYEPAQKAQDVKLLEDLTDRDLEEISKELVENGEKLLEKLVEEFPSLESLFYPQTPPLPPIEPVEPPIYTW